MRLFHLPNIPGAYCVVSGCNAEYSAYKKAGIGVSFHKFLRPIYFVSQAFLSKWIRRCGTRNIDPLKNHICYNHFSPTDYKRDLQNKYLGLPLKKKLKKTSVLNKNLQHVVLAVIEVNDKNQLVSPEVPFGNGSENADYKIKYSELLS
ncbi:unnamed protein product [Psylliodes chrysocephalus]|uniref:THAP-type domain-containing protein n=1 Tax=Psylliodes chrysocephalus TaxID=3402493 RepID=A0A9P0G4X1_9CUCU|nr:unnamed protein product [Psylliodes chrysocephala]